MQVERCRNITARQENGLDLTSPSVRARAVIVVLAANADFAIEIAEPLFGMGKIERLAQGDAAQQGAIFISDFSKGSEGA